MLKRATACALLMLAAQALIAAAQAIHVTPLVRDGRVYVSFKLSDAFNNEELRAAVHSGLTIQFVYDVELRRGASLWLDRTLDAATVSAGVRYDNLERRYHLELRADGRLEVTDIVDREEKARQWLTEFDKLNLFSSVRLEPNVEYYVRVRARTTPRNTSFVWPWQGTDVAGLAKFTFLR
jgi:Domain of unknown function (DUF4390)